MKIGSVKNSFKQTIPPWVVNKIKDGVMTMELIAVATGGAYVGKQLMDMEYGKNNNELVNQYNQDKYNEMPETNLSDTVWNKAVSNIEDSLRQDSIAITNYAKGLQSVRDSLENVQQ